MRPAAARSLDNIFREYADDLGFPIPANGDLTPWTRARRAAAEPGAHRRSRASPAAHRGKGWEEVTDQAIRALAARDEPLVAILWGRDARSLAPLLGELPLHRVGASQPELSADRGFFGSRPFSRANALLEQQGAEPVDWKLP